MIFKHWYCWSNNLYWEWFSNLIQFHTNNINRITVFREMFNCIFLIFMFFDFHDDFSNVQLTYKVWVWYEFIFYCSPSDDVIQRFKNGKCDVCKNDKRVRVIYQLMMRSEQKLMTNYCYERYVWTFANKRYCTNSVFLWSYKRKRLTINIAKLLLFMLFCLYEVITTPKYFE